MKGVQPVMVPFRKYLYPLLRGYHDMPQQMLNHGSTRRAELHWRRRFAHLEDGVDLSELWERGMEEREQHRSKSE